MSALPLRTITQTITIMESDTAVTPINNALAALTLNFMLADEFVLMIKLKNAQWNVTGPNYLELEILFEEQFIRLNEIINGIAGRISSLGHCAPANLQSFKELTSLTENQHSNYYGSTCVAELLDDHEFLIRDFHEKRERFLNSFNDPDTAEYITDQIDAHQEMASQLRNYQP